MLVRSIIFEATKSTETTTQTEPTKMAKPVKKAKAGTIKVGSKGWKYESKDGKFLCELLKSKKISAGITPGALKELYPQFQAYKDSLFYFLYLSVAVLRMLILRCFHR
jgi:hypothetical protein